MYGRFVPFREGDTFTTFDNLVKKVTQEVDSLENEYVMKASTTELENYFENKVLIEPLEIDSDNFYVENQKSVKQDVLIRA